MPRSVLSPPDAPDPPKKKKRESKPPLTQQQIKFAQEYGRTGKVRDSLRKAGYSDRNTGVYPVLKNEAVGLLVAREREENAKAIRMTRERVMNGFLEAVDIARAQEDPVAMIRGWSEVARMCGFYAPETKKIELSLTAKGIVDSLERISDEELMRYALEAEDVPFTLQGGELGGPGNPREDGGNPREAQAGEAPDPLPDNAEADLRRVRPAVREADAPEQEGT